MPFDANAIANYFLERAKSEGKSLDQMKVQKLVFYANGWHLALKGTPLIHEEVEAWRYGPVIPSLRESFRQYGNQPIDSPAFYIVSKSGDSPYDDMELEEIVPTIDQNTESDLVFTKSLLDRIWQVYGKFTGIQLSNMTHEPGSPWHQIFMRYNQDIPKGKDIPQDIIEGYFVDLAKKKAPSR